MHYRISFIFVTFISLFCFALPGVAQDANTDESKPVIMYSGTPKKYEIADIKVEGVKNYEDYVLIGLSGLSVGQTITVPGDEITGAIKRYWRHGLFSNVSITAEKIEGNKIWLKITLAQRPRISDIRYHGVKKSEREDLQTKLGMIKGSQITPNLVDRAKVLSKRYFDDKGFKNAEITITQRDDPANENQVLVDIDIDKKEKVKVHAITFAGNHAIKTSKLKRVMKKTNEKGKLLNLFRTKKFVNEKYEGYLFYTLDPVEVNIDNDSIDLEMRIFEGRQASINKIKINGNDRLYENVVRRELRTRPGELFSREDLMRSMREIQQMGHFDPENIKPDIQPDPVNGTVDIAYDLVSKANDQVEFSAGWGQTGVIGKLSLKFTNFSLANLLHPGENYRGILPQGDGQTLTISGQTNAQYYQQYSISFFDPWFGGKRPNSFSLSAFFSVQTDISSRYYNSSYYNNYYNSYYSGLGGYGMYNYGNYNNYENYYDPDKSIKMWGLSAGWGKRLNWPDDYFQLSAELSYQRYILKDWQYFPVTNGKCNDLSIGLTLARASYDNPIYPRSGSDFSLSVQFTPPYSLFDGVDYSKYNEYNQNDMNKMHKWVEYHKWKFKAKTYIPLLNPTVVKKTPVLMTRVEFGILGHYNKYKKSPFGTFDVGGDGMTGYSSYATESVALRGYENSSLTPYRGQEGYAYTRIGFELRYPLMLETSTNIYALTFLEAGNAWHDVKNFNPFDLKRSAGVGVRIFLPMIGMMGIDWAYGFDKVLGDKSAGGSRFHFVLGQEF